MTNPGVILLAHGARDPAWALPFEKVAQRLRARDDKLNVRLAYIEHTQPDFATALAGLAAMGCRTVDVLPLFLGSGGHVRRDVPALVQAGQQAHPAIELRLHGAAGEHDMIIDAMVALASRVLEDAGAGKPT